MHPARRTARHAVALAAILSAMAMVAAGCGDDGGSAVASVVTGKATHQRATTEEAAAGAEIVTHVGAELYAPIAKGAGDGNLTYSPLSITTALGMARAGAKGPSAEQLDGFFGDADPATVHRAINAAGEALHDLTGPVKLSNGDMGHIDLSDANALWGQSGVTWEQPFLDELKSSYDAGMWTTDYSRDPDRSRVEINDWIAEHTHEHITELIPKDSIDDLTRLTLTNALWFKAPWPEELDEFHAGKKATFTALSGKEVDAKLLHTTEQFVYGRGSGWQSVRLPYAGGKLAMTLVLPDEGQLGAVEAKLDGDLLHQVLTGGEATAVSLTFPKFDLDQRIPLAAILKGLGVTAPFTTETDFEPMTTDPAAQPLFVHDVLHQATVTVDEHGTEASAATAVVFNTVGAMLTDHEVTFDRPFLFVIHDVANATPIFIGRVADPTVK